MANFTWTPDTQPVLTEKPRILEAKFGDGYSQSTLDGLNAILEEWQLQFSNRPLATISAIRTFLRTAGGVSTFTWTNPLGVTKSYVCKEWSVTPNYSLDAALTAKFEEKPTL